MQFGICKIGEKTAHEETERSGLKMIDYWTNISIIDKLKTLTIDDLFKDILPQGCCHRIRIRRKGRQMSSLLVG